MIARGGSFSGKERNCCFLNTHGPRFADVSATTGLDLIDDARGLALVDWDHDGDLDLWLANRTSPRVRFMRNDMPTTHHSLALRLRGVRCNRDAVGARVEVYLPGQKTPLIQTLRAGEGFLSQSSKWLHFGLGDASTVERVVVRWPASDVEQVTEEVFASLNADGRYELVQGSGSAQTASPRSTVVQLQAKVVQPLPVTDVARTVLFKRRELSAITYRDFAGDMQTLAASNKPLLVNLWASWCSPCLVELSEFAQSEPQWRSRGLEMVAFCTDLQQEEPDPKLETARAFLDQSKLPFRTAIASEKLLQELTRIHNEVYYAQRPLPLPCSFLLDATGRIAVIYKGPVTPDQVMADMDLLTADAEQLAQHALPFPGARLLRSFDPSPLAMADAYREGSYLDEAKAATQSYLQEVNSTQNLDAMADALQGALRPPVTPEQSSSEATAVARPQNQQRQTQTAAIRQQLETLRRREQIRAYELLARIENERGDRAAEITARRASLQLQRENPTAHVQLATAYLFDRQPDQAAAVIAEAEKIQEWNANQHVAMGRLQVQMGQLEPGIQHLQRAIEMAPDQPQAYLDLAMVRQMESKVDEAILLYEQLLKTHPDLPELLNNLAWIRATSPDDALRKGDQAVQLAEHLCQLTEFRVASFLDTLAAAYAEAGRFEKAIGTSQTAIDLATKENNESLVKKLRQRMELYRARKSYRDGG